MNRDLLMLRKNLEAAERGIDMVKGQISERKEELLQLSNQLVDDVDEDMFRSFMDEPYLILPRRREEWMGRVMHGKGKGEHVIIMTPLEMDKYAKRLDALYERQLKVRIITED